jgi:DNA polymerase III subunit chi
MGAAYFYHLTDGPLESTLPALVAKAQQAGWRVEIRGTDAARIAALDLALWQGGQDGFLPHGIAGGLHDADQPVLLTATGQVAANGPACVMCIDRAEIAVAEVQALARVCILFDGHDGEALDHARAQWKRLTDAGCAAQYWAQDGGGWTKKAERGG